MISCMSQQLENNNYSQLRLCSLCIDITMVGHIQVHQHRLLTCLDLPYHCVVNRHPVQHQQGAMIRFKLLGHTGIKHNEVFRKCEDCYCLYYIQPKSFIKWGYVQCKPLFVTTRNYGNILMTIYPDVCLYIPVILKVSEWAVAQIFKAQH